MANLNVPTGGILAWQYFGALKEEDETPEEETEVSEEKEPENITMRLLNNCFSALISVLYLTRLSTIVKPN